MSERAVAQPQKTAGSTNASARSHLLQRRCACGDAPDLDGECRECRRKRLGLRAAIDPVSPKVIQTKLLVSQPGDRYEREADRIAEQVMRMPSSRSVQRKCISCEEDDQEVQRKPKESWLMRREAGDGLPTHAASSIVNAAINSGSGRPLDDSARAFFEPRFGHDFSQVRVHTDARAAESARAVNAQAYTVGRDIVFGAGRFAPETQNGQRLLAHELTHVVQQGAAAKAAMDCQAPLPHASTPSLDQSDRQVPTIHRAPLPISESGAPLQTTLFRAMNPACGQDIAQVSSMPVTNALIGGDLKLNFEPAAQFEFAIPFSSGEIRHADIVVIKDKEAFVYEIKPRHMAAAAVTQVQGYIGNASVNCDPELNWLPGFSYPSFFPRVLYNPVSGEAVVAWQQPYTHPGVILFDTKTLEPDWELIKILVIAGATAGALAALKKAASAVASAAVRDVLVYAQAVAAVALVLVYSERVEAQPFSGESPLTALFRAMREKGVPVPPELEKMIEENPELKAIFEEAATTGDWTAAQQELHRRMLQTINDNLDQFSVEDLRLVLQVTEATSLAKDDPTVAQLRTFIEQKRETSGKEPEAAEHGEGTVGERDWPGEVKEPSKYRSQPEHKRLAREIRRDPDLDKAFTKLLGMTGVEPDVEFLRRFVALKPFIKTHLQAVLEYLAQKSETPLTDPIAQIIEPLEQILLAEEVKLEQEIAESKGEAGEGKRATPQPGPTEGGPEAANQMEGGVPDGKTEVTPGAGKGLSAEEAQAGVILQELGQKLETHNFQELLKKGAVQFPGILFTPTQKDAKADTPRTQVTILARVGIPPGKPKLTYRLPLKLALIKQIPSKPGFVWLGLYQYTIPEGIVEPEQGPVHPIQFEDRGPYETEWGRKEV